MDLDTVRAAIKVAELGTYTKAAEALGLSKSRVSQCVIALEAELGVRLFQRTTRVVRPTADGERFIERAGRLLAEADDIGALFRGPRNLEGRVRIDLPTLIARTTIIPRLPELLHLHPQLRVEIGCSDRRVDVRREGVDFAVRIGAVGDDSLNAIRLGEMPMANCVSVGYAQRHGLPRDLADLAAHTVVHYSMTFADSPAFEYVDGAAIRSVPMHATVTVNNAEAYRAACLAGLGIIQVPRHGVRDLVGNGTLIEVLPGFTCAPMPVAIVHAHGRHVPRRVRAVIQWVASLLEAHARSR